MAESVAPTHDQYLLHSFRQVRDLYIDFLLQHIVSHEIIRSFLLIFQVSSKILNKGMSFLTFKVSINEVISRRLVEVSAQVAGNKQRLLVLPKVQKQIVNDILRFLIIA